MLNDGASDGVFMRVGAGIGGRLLLSEDIFENGVLFVCQDGRGQMDSIGFTVLGEGRLTMRVSFQAFVLVCS